MATTKRAAEPKDVLRMAPGKDPVVSYYLKLEPRDRTRKKYLTKARNRIKELEYALPSMGWDKKAQEHIRADLSLMLDYLADENRLPDSQGVALFASQASKLFEVRPLPRVHRSRLAVDRTPLVREMAASESEFGRVFTVTLDRATALIWEVTAFDAKVVQKVSTEVMRGGRYHAAGARGDSTGEHAFHNRIRDEKRRHMETVARALFELDRLSPGHQIVIAGAGKDAEALEPFLHNYLAERLIGFAKLAPKDATPEAVQQLTLAVRADFAHNSAAHHIEELAEGLGTGWAVNGVRQTLKALAQGQVRLLLVRGDAVTTGFRSMTTGRLSTLARDLREDGEVMPTVDVIDDAIEEALRQHVALDVIYDAEAGEAVDGLAGLLRFK
jgi:peptide subunit release factor 1 (eRF1)